MGDTRFFHVIYGGAHELPRTPFQYERGLQELFEKHLHALTGVHFLDREYSTGQRHSRRIDTLGIDDAGAPVVIEYKRRHDENVINQGLDYLAWLEDHRAEFRELVRTKLGAERHVDFQVPRLLCIAGEFPHQDKVAAQNSRRRIELLRYRRYGDAYVALDWVYGGPEPATPRRTQPATAEKRPATPTPKPGHLSPSNYSIYRPWNKTSEATRQLFRKLETRVKSLGNVKTDAFKNEMSIKRSDASGRETVIAYVINMYSRTVGIRLIIRKTLLHGIPLDDGFTQPFNGGRYRAFILRGDEDIEKAEPLLRAAYENLLGGQSRP